MCVVNGVHELLFPTSAMRCVEALKCFNIQASMNNFKTFHVYLLLKIAQPRDGYHKKVKACMPMQAPVIKVL